MTILQGGRRQDVTAVLKMLIDLPARDAGPVCAAAAQRLSGKTVTPYDLVALIEETGAARGVAFLDFTLFVRRVAPVSRGKSLLDIECEIGAILEDATRHIITGVTVPVLAVCPVSREISSRGAHNQRSLARALVRSEKEVITLESLAHLLEDQGSSPVWPLLKRRDEKIVTEAAFERPRNALDIVSGALERLRNIDGVLGAEVRCEIFESLATWNSYACSAEGLPCESLSARAIPSFASAHPGSSLSASLKSSRAPAT
jgi:hypothetical protein